jgi:hypothetical protein
MTTRNHELPRPSQGLHGETMGKPQPLVKLTPTGPGGVPNTTDDLDVPNTPEQNLPGLEYSGAAPLPEEGPIAAGEARPASEYQSKSILEGLPETISREQLVSQAKKYGGL